MDVEMKRAMERHDQGLVRVIPIILRECDWHRMPFGGLKALPHDGKAVTSSPNRDEAFAEVAREIRRVLVGRDKARPSSPASPPREPPTRSSRVLSVNLAKTWTDRDRDDFLEAGYESIADIVESSLSALPRTSPSLDTRFRRGSQRFSAIVYQHGKVVASCTVGVCRKGSGMGTGIAFAYDASADVTRSFNEMLHVESSPGGLFFHPVVNQHASQLNAEQAAELLWNMLVQPLQA